MGNYLHFVVVILECSVEACQLMSDSDIVSKSLLVTQPRAPLTEEESKRFCLGLVGWCPCADCSPPSESSSLDSLEMER